MIKLACHQTNPIFKDKAANFASLAASVSECQADLHVFPELALTGYNFVEPEEIAPLAEAIGGPLASDLSKLAKRIHTAIITGFLENDHGKFYNSSLLFDSQGVLRGHYRKVHLFDLEKDIFEPGDLGFPVVDLVVQAETVRVGMMICYDWRFPEAARSLALGGAQIIMIPANIVTTSAMLLPTVQTRAFENKVFIGFADRVGLESNPGRKGGPLRFQGQSAIVSQSGAILQQLPRDGIGTIVSEIEPSLATRKSLSDKNDLFQDRRKDSYHL